MKNIILGAGISGITCSHELKKYNINSIVLEKNNNWGGLLDNFSINGFRFDKFIHLSFAKDDYVNDIFYQTPFIKHKPLSSNYYKGTWLKHPAQNNLYPLNKEEQPDVVFHLSGQVAMTTSISNPRLDFEINALGTFNLLDSIRKYSPNAMVLYSSTNKVYGDFDDLTFEENETRYTCKEYPDGFDESMPLNFRSPYACSKGAADQYLLDFYRIFGIKTVVFRHSSMYGGNQHATIDQGWVGWFVQKALEIKSGNTKEQFTISGNGKQVRDVLYSSDVVSLYFKAVENIEIAKGQSFNIGGGIANSLSLLELFKLLENILKIKMTCKQLPSRENDQLVFVANNQKAEKLLNWKPNVVSNDGIKKMVHWLKSIS
jgi:CDP-paratose 2-epimerase